MTNPLEDVRDEIKESLKAIENKQDVLKKALASYRRIPSSDYILTLKWMESNEGVLSGYLPQFETLREKLRRYCNDFLLKYEAELLSRCAAFGFSIAGQWPSYTIEYIVPLVIDEKRLAVTVGSEAVDSLELDGILKTVKRTLDQLTPSDADLTEFLGELYRFYEELSGAGKSDSISIWKLYREMVISRQNATFWRDAKSASFRQYSIIEFKAHITHLLLKNRLKMVGFELKLLPPLSAKDGVLVYQPAEARFGLVGRAQFVRTGGYQ